MLNRIPAVMTNVINNICQIRPVSYTHLNRILLFGALSPFGLAYFSASFPAQKKVYGIVAACLGVLLGGFGLVSLKYVGSIVIVAAFSLLMNKELSKHKWLYGLIASLALVANGLIDVCLLYTSRCV